MTKEKLQNEAKVFATYYESLFPNEFETFYKAFLKIAEPREKRIEELEKIIEQMQDAKCVSCTDLGGMLLKITDLEKKNAELKARVEKRDTDILTLKGLTERQRIKLEKETAQRVYNFNKSIEWKEKHRVLKKENADFKKQIKEYKNGNFVQTVNQIIEGKDKRLEQAKEILREYIRINLLPPIERNFDDEVKLFKQAEQFLKDLEK